MKKWIKNILVTIVGLSFAASLFFLVLPYGVYIEYHVKFNPKQAWAFVATKAPIVYVINASEVDQGVTGNGRTMKAFIDAIGGTRKATLKILHTSKNTFTDYTLTTNEIVTDNIATDIDHGARIVGAGNFTISGSFEHGLSQCFGSSITIVFGSGSVREVYPQWWGATGDGVTDDSSALYKFFVAAEGKTAFIPDGTYMAKKLRIMDNTHVKGESFSAIIKTISTAEVGDFLFRLSAKNNVTIEGLKIDGNKDNTPGGVGFGITLIDVLVAAAATSENIIIKNNYILNNHHGAISINGDGSIDNIIVDGNIIDTTDCGVFASIKTLTNLNVINNLIKNGTSEGVSMWGLTSNKQGEKFINIANNIIHDKMGGIQLRWGNLTTITGNTIYDCNNGIAFYNSATYPREVTITGNTISTSIGDAIQGPIEDSLISNNTIIESGSCGIWIKTNSKNVVISSNFIKNVDTTDIGADGIRLTDSTNITVIGNLIIDDHTPAGARSGIRLLGASGDHCTIIGNHVKDCASCGIEISDAENTHLFDNYVEGIATGIIINATALECIARNNWVDGVEWIHYESITTSVALSLNKPSRVNSNGGVLALTLADGSAIGQQKMISMVTAGNNADVTITHHETNDDEVARLDAIDEYLLLVWTGTEWATINNTCTFP
jgi:parallel beta-helix repeat protein